MNDAYRKKLPDRKVARDEPEEKTTAERVSSWAIGIFVCLSLAGWVLMHR
ncbi:MAG: hypothetical protein KGK16_09570 [Bradyrhizobium sp.]|nr:hypothetical protein [Bradyrhizobium sp.]